MTNYKLDSPPLSLSELAKRSKARRQAVLRRVQEQRAAIGGEREAKR